MNRLTSIIFEERSGLDRRDEPVTMGCPFPRGRIGHAERLILLSADGRRVPLQVTVLNAWADGTVKWALLDFLATVNASTVSQYELCYANFKEDALAHDGYFTVQRFSEFIVINTGAVEFGVDTNVFKPFSTVRIAGKSHLTPRGTRIVLVDEKKQKHQPYIQSIAVESYGPIRLTLAARGHFGAAPDTAFANFLARLNFWSNSGIVEIQFTLHNPRAALHPAGLWDLGDAGSIFFRDLTLYAEIAGQESLAALWKTVPGGTAAERPATSIEIYQDSSGGQNWQSTNHVDRDGRVTREFCGYRVTVDGHIVESGKRALPTIGVRCGEKILTGAVVDFWQNFPKALQIEEGELALRLFPTQFGDLHELQGGEQKTHTLFLVMHSGKQLSLDWIHARLHPRLDSDWYAESKAFSYIGLGGLTPNRATFELAEQLVDGAVNGESTFFDRREIIDEYGWRNFGDLYADHEAVGWKGKEPLVAHYNNQYDVVYGGLAQYVRTGNHRWFRLADDLAKHVIDIDIYHTQEDRPEFNGGMFWHTDHYKDVATATHRTYSKANLRSRSVSEYGGGPSNEHNYTTGLMYYYFITGSILAREAVQSLADWVINRDVCRRGFWGWFDTRPSGCSSATVTPDYHGPGRGSGNSINALLDAYSITQDIKYLKKAEELIQRCIHPNDDVEVRNLEDIEHRWSYLVFLQVLGKYLDLKTELGSVDYMFAYAQASLLHYVKWMLVHEVPYSTILDRVEIPSETWPAQDIRKSVIFFIAAKHSEEPMRSQCLERGHFFFDASVQDLLAFPTCRLTRPVVLLMTHAFICVYFCAHVHERAPRYHIQSDFGEPKKFTPQLAELYIAREVLRAGMRRFKEKKQKLVQRTVQLRQYI